MFPVSTLRGDRPAPALTAVEPSTRFAARVAAGIFGGEALLLLAVAVLPNPGGWSSWRLVIPAVCGAVALLLLRFADRVSPRTLEVCVAFGIMLVTVQAWRWGSGPANADEMLYVWLGLYVAYFFSPREAAGQLAFMAAAYLFVLIASAPSDSVAATWVTLVGILFPAAALLRVVRDGVTRLVRSLSEAALTDALTGLRNRLALDQELGAEVERALRAGRPLSVVTGDLDHFKTVNDRLGHRAGDAALVRVGAILERERRAGDSIARTGGEEFTILLPGAKEHQAYLGIATYPAHGRSADAVLEAADQALYAAKALGRNRCVIFNSEISAIFAPAAGRGADEVQLATLLSLAEALDLRDTGTADHSRSVGRYCGLIALELGLPPEHVKRIEIAGMLHDIGKIGLPDAILQKPSRLGTAELAQIRTHPEIGAQILSGRGLEDLRAWVLAHHERPDGKGYPFGLLEAQIPLEARILAVADAYEAMIADRVYRAGLGERTARGELLRCSGIQFDSRVVAALLAVLRRHDAAEAGLVCTA
jgi:HD-GYP domain-containing protein (c-di-GMP phosphodiesterase class II)